MIQRLCRWTVVWAFCGGVLYAADVAAQEAASIVGRVTDESGAVLPGVTVTAKSPALQVGSASTVTDAQGDYRLTPLSIGTYEVDFELSGFQGVRREGVRLTVGFTARVDISLGVGALEEQITVTAVSPLVDVSSTTATTQFTREQLEVLPTSRNGLLSLMAQAPGVRGTLETGGAVTFSPPGTRVFGQGAEPWYVIEGVFTTSLQTEGAMGQYWDYNAIEEAAVQTLGTNAEVGSRGVSINAVIKTGGNNFSGSVFGARMGDALQSSNIDDDLAAQGITEGGELRERYDVSAELGGRILRDKLWFYGTGRYRFNQTEVLDAVKTDGSPATADQGQRFLTTKLSYQINPTNRVVGFYQYSLRKPSSAGTVTADWVSRSTSYLYQRVQKLEWQTQPTSSMVLSVQWGQWIYWDPRRFCIGKEELNGAECPGSEFDRFLNYSTGAPVNEGETLEYSRHHPKATFSWYKPNLGGDHNFRAGAEFMPNRGYRGNYVPLSGQNYRRVFDNGVPVEIEAWNYPTLPDQRVDYFGLYAQDSWTIGRRLTLNLGLRYGHDNAYIPESCRDAALAPTDAVFPAACYDRVQFNIQNMFSPRLRFAYDLTGDGLTVIKGGWGRYNQMHMIDPDVQGTDPNNKATARFRWNDLNLNRQYDDGEVNWNRNGPGFIANTGGFNQQPNPEEVTPKSDEFSLSVERQLPGAMAARLSTVYSRASDIYRLLNLLRPPDVWTTEITRPDPGNDGLVGTADDPGTSVTFFRTRRRCRADPSSGTRWSTTPTPRRPTRASRWRWRGGWSTAGSSRGRSRPPRPTTRSSTGSTRRSSR